MRTWNAGLASSKATVSRVGTELIRQSTAARQRFDALPSPTRTALLSCVLGGAGQISIGQTKKGVVIIGVAVVLGLFTLGVGTRYHFPCCLRCVRHRRPVSDTRKGAASGSGSGTQLSEPHGRSCESNRLASVRSFSAWRRSGSTIARGSDLSIAVSRSRRSGVSRTSSSTKRRRRRPSSSNRR